MTPSAFAPARTRTTLATLLLLLAVAALAVVPQAASAAPRKVARDVFGVVIDPFLNDPAVSPDAVLDAQLTTAALHGVESVRVAVRWENANPAPGIYDWTITDATMRATATHGLSVLAITENTPKWASSKPDAQYYMAHKPTDYNTYGTFITELLKRYGSKGTFWALNPQLPKIPMEYIQFWNEPPGFHSWRETPWYPSYVKLLKAGYKAAHAADPKARVVTGALTGLTRANGQRTIPEQQIAGLYRNGAKGYFDVLAVNAYYGAESVSESVDGLAEVARQVSAVMRKHGEPNKPIFYTETGWTAAKGQLPKGAAAFNFDLTYAGQRARLPALYDRIARGKMGNVKRAYWFTWTSPYTTNWPYANPVNFRYTGLTKWLPDGSMVPTKLLSTYAASAKKWQGCTKTADARKCAK